MKANRASWVVHYGAIPEGLSVAHKCDNPPCTNPKHLFLATHLENMQDAAKKGRLGHGGIFGEENAAHKLTEKEVIEIRRLYIPVYGAQSILDRTFGVSTTAIWFIVHGKHWKGV